MDIELKKKQNRRMAWLLELDTEQYLLRLRIGALRIRIREEKANLQITKSEEPYIAELGYTPEQHKREFNERKKLVNRLTRMMRADKRRLRSDKQ